MKANVVADLKNSTAEQVFKAEVSIEKKPEKIESESLSSENEDDLEDDEPQLSSDDAPPEEEKFDEKIEEFSFDSKVKLNVEDFSKTDLPARKLWGILTVKLREKNYVTLHTACGEIRDVFREENLVKAYVYEDYLFNILTKQENFDKILFELRQIDDKISLEFILKRVGKNKIKNNLQLLKNLFGDDLLVE